MFDKFSERHIGVSNEKDLKAMLEVIGAKSVDELISQVIPQSIRLKKPLALPAEGMSEYEFAAHIRSLADRNRCLRSFIGMGYYPCAVPAAIVRNVFENPAWYTSYTPYQAGVLEDVAHDGGRDGTGVVAHADERSEATARSWTRARPPPKPC